jgi:hypothetical protein
VQPGKKAGRKERMEEERREEEEERRKKKRVAGSAWPCRVDEWRLRARVARGHATVWRLPADRSAADRQGPVV